MGDIRLELDLAEHMQSRIFWLGGYNLGLLRLLSYRLKPGMVFLDVGANIGEVSLFAAKRVAHDGCVFAFEPSPVVVGRLRRHVSINPMNNIKVIELGLGPSPGNMTLFQTCLPGAYDTANQGLASLVPPIDGGVPIAGVQVDTLDRWVQRMSLARVDMIKVDIEGGEIGFLEGAEKTITRFRPELIIEVAEDSLRAAGHTSNVLLQRLHAMSYNILTINDLGGTALMTGKAPITFANVLCLPCERPCHAEH
jgi:FkbM family methyltransferase